MSLKNQVVTAFAVAAFSFVVSPWARANDINSLRELQLDLLEQFDLMQQEIQMLRGMVEEQAQRIETLESDGRARYLDLDSRLSALQSPVNSGSQNDDSVVSGTAPANEVELGDPAQESAEYQAAFGLIRERQYDQAVVAIERFIQRYPQGKLLPDAYYWLGQVFEVQNKPAQAIGVFQLLIREFPDYRRVLQARLDMGRLQLTLDEVSGRETLQELITLAPDSPEAAKAQSLLSE